MRNKLFCWVSAAALLLPPLAAHAAESEEGDALFGAFLAAILPLVGFVGLIYWVTRGESLSRRNLRLQEFLRRVNSTRTRWAFRRAVARNKRGVLAPQYATMQEARPANNPSTRDD
ncbi:MAG: hypothetical protein HZA91_04885 [Verrucomicrobia bacterium]|nr:hypothetical protein [Verrucomicrobiota bacterium]